MTDNGGGFKGKNQVKALLMCCVGAALAGTTGFQLFYLEDVIHFTIGLFCLLFFGSTIVPTCFGVIISSARREQQSASSAFGQVFFNLAGFFLAPNISGYVMD